MAKSAVHASGRVDWSPSRAHSGAAQHERPGERGGSAAGIAAFVTIAFGISWGLWSLHPFVAHDQGIALALDQLATFGPAAAALLVADRRVAPSGTGDQFPRMRVILVALATPTVTVLLLVPRWADVSSPMEGALRRIAAAPGSLYDLAGIPRDLRPCAPVRSGSGMRSMR